MKELFEVTGNTPITEAAVSHRPLQTIKGSGVKSKSRFLLMSEFRS